MSANNSTIDPPAAPRALDKMATWLLALPYVAIKRGVVKTNEIRNNQVPAISPPSPNIIPSPSIDFRVADRVHCSLMGNLKVCFYLYVAHRCIRAVARKRGITKEVFFTPEIAKAKSLTYDIEGAIEWVRTVGFKNEIKESIPVVAVPQLTANQIIDVPAQPTPAAKAVPTSNAVLTPFNKQPFSGRVMFLGESQRPGRNGEPPYTTFLVKLKSEFASIEREFVGEHLAELSNDKGVKVGDSVRIQLLGRNDFEVINNGRTEKRRRNEYALEVL